MSLRCGDVFGDQPGHVFWMSWGTYGHFGHAINGARVVVEASFGHLVGDVLRN